MKPGCVICGLLLCLVPAAGAEELGPVGEIRIDLPFPGPAGAWPGRTPLFDIVPRLLIWRSRDGTTAWSYALEDRWRGRLSLDRGEALVFAEAIEAYFTTGEEQATDAGIKISAGKDGEVILVLPEKGAGKAYRCAPDYCRHLVRMIRASTKAARLFGEAGAHWPPEGLEEKLGDLALSQWQMSFPIGEIEFREYGTHAIRIEGFGGMEGKASYHMRLMKTSAGGWRVLVPELLEVLARVPPQFEQGKVFRWKSGDMRIRGFPENKAIYLESGREREPLRISYDTAQKAQSVIDQRNELQDWFETKVRPGLARKKDK